MDVIVVGAGPSGLMAGLAAARLGAKTLLVERSGHLCGGMGSSNSNYVNGTHNTVTGDCVIKGIPAELIDRMISEGVSRDYVILSNGAGILPFDAEGIKFIADDMIRDAGVKVLFHTIATDVMVEDQAVGGLVLYNKSGFQEVPAKVVIDASGYGDVAVAAGAQFEIAELEELQMHTLMFKLSHVDMEEIIRYSEEHSDTVSFTPDHLGAFGFADIIQQANEDAQQQGEAPPFTRRIVIALSTLVPGEYWMLMTDAPAVGVDGEALSQLEFTARDQVRRAFKGLKEHIPGFKDSYLSEIAPCTGVRETRRITGEYVLTKEDIVRGREFDDVVCRLSHHIDLHDNMKRGHTTVALETPRGSYDVPYRCLVPKGAEGLLVAGKCISTDNEAWGAMRIQANCLMTGQVAGVAAAIAAQEGVSPRSVDIKKLQEKLAEMGVLGT